MEQQSATVWTTARVTDILRTLAKEEELPSYLTSAEISDTDTLETLGIDSIGAVALVDRLESEAGVLLPDDFLDFTDTMLDVVKRMNSLD